VSETFQLFPALEPTVDAALRESIIRFGVLVPVAKDQNGRILDGHQRSRIAVELGVKFRVDVHHVASDDEARDLAHTLNADRRQLSVEQRREVVAVLREQGHSLRAIAGAVGTTHVQVIRDLAGGTDVPPDTVRGKDGKLYKAKRTVVAAKSAGEAERAQTALAALDASALGVIDVKRAERLAREAEAGKRREQPPTPSTDQDIEIIHGDFATALGDVDLIGATIISDPPYPREHLPLWEQLAQFALDEGVSRLVLMTGQSILLDSIDAIRSAFNAPVDEYSGGGQRWQYRWCGAYLTPGPAARVWRANVSTAWKPILVFDLEHDERTFLTRDVFQSSGDDKQHHHWGQNAEGIAQLVETFTSPGDLVVDPFLGGGTTALVCRDLGRRFIGCDIDVDAVNATLDRLAA